MLNQNIILYLGLSVLLGVVLLQPAALWVSVSLAGLLAFLAARKTGTDPRHREEEIAELNQAIQRCAFQSNLLAMNAAVEAAGADAEYLELALRMERAAHDARSMVEQRIRKGGSRLNVGAMDKLAQLLEASNRDLSAGTVLLDRQTMQRNVSSIERLLRR